MTTEEDKFPVGSDEQYGFRLAAVAAYKQLHSDYNVVNRMDEMCTESLSPDVYEQWNAVVQRIKSIRSAFQNPSPISSIPDQLSNEVGEKHHGFYCHDLDHGVCSEKCVSQCEDCGGSFPSPEQPKGEIPEEIEKWIENNREDLQDGFDWKRGAIAMYRHLQQQIMDGNDAYALLEQAMDDLVLKVICWTVDQHVTRAGNRWGKDYSNIAYDDKGIVDQFLSQQHSTNVKTKNDEVH